MRLDGTDQHACAQGPGGDHERHRDGARDEQDQCSGLPVGGRFGGQDRTPHADRNQRNRANQQAAGDELLLRSPQALGVADCIGDLEAGEFGADGLFRLNLYGTVERGLAILEIQPGGIQVIDPAPRSFAPGY